MCLPVVSALPLPMFPGLKYIYKATSKACQTPRNFNEFLGFKVLEFYSGFSPRVNSEVSKK